MKRQHWWIASLLICALAPFADARPGVLKTQDGKSIEGEIEEKPESVTITVHGIKTVFPRDTVTTVEYFDNIEARYKDKLARLPKSPAAADHLEIARWLLSVKSYDLATVEVDKARKIEPNSTDAQTLENVIMGQRKLDRTKPPANGTTTKPPVNGEKPPTDKPAAGDKKLLTPEDINTIRQVEWRENDQMPPRVVVPVDLRKRFINYKAYNAAEFAAYKPAEQAYLILTQGLPEMRSEIRIISDPTAMADFRRIVQPVLVSGCAAAACHGGAHGGRFHVIATNTDREDVAYTNFFILTRYKQQVGEKEYAMIDRSYPDRSILAEFLLPPDQAEVDHPELKGQVYKPISPNRNDAKYKAITGWMKTLVAGEPKYGITLELPSDKPAKPDPAKPDPAKPDPAKTPATVPPDKKPAELPKPAVPATK